MSAIELLVAIVGWPVSAWLGYRLGLRSQRLQRDAEKREAIAEARTEYVGFIRGWIYSFSKKIFKPGGWERDYDAFFDEVPLFISLSEKVRADLPEDSLADFDTVTKGIYETTHSDFYKERFDYLVSACERLIKVTQNAQRE
jgi:hypothetical protein